MANTRYPYQDDRDTIYRITEKKPLNFKEFFDIALKFFDGCTFENNSSEDFIEAKNILVEDKEFGEDIRNFYDKHYKIGNKYQKYKDYFQDLKSVSEKVITIIVDNIKKENLEKRMNK